MKKRSSFTVGLPLAVVALLVASVSYGQTSRPAVIKKTAYTKEKFAVAAKPAIAYKPLTMADLAKGSKNVDANKPVKLPNKKTVTAGVYLKNMNTLEKNLNAIGYSAVNNNADEIVIATTKSNAVKLQRSLPVSSLKTAKLSAAAVKDRFTNAEIKLGSTNFKAVPLSNLTPTTVKSFKSTSKMKLYMEIGRASCRERV